MNTEVTRIGSISDIIKMHTYNTLALEENPRFVLYAYGVRECLFAHRRNSFAGLVTMQVNITFAGIVVCPGPNQTSTERSMTLLG